MITRGEKAEMIKKIARFLGKVFDKNGNIFICLLIGMAIQGCIFLLLIQTEVGYENPLEIWAVTAALFVGFATLSSAIWALRAVTVARETHKYEIVTKRIDEYGSEEMLFAISDIMEFYRRDKQNFAYRYVELHREYMDGTLQGEDFDDFKKLHHHRRVLGRFYEVLAWTYDEDYINIETINKFWTKDTLKIIPDVILPIEKGLYNDIHKDRRDYPYFFDLMQNLYDEASKVS